MGCKWQVLADTFEPTLYVPWADPDEQEMQVITELSKVVGITPVDIMAGAEAGALKFYQHRVTKNLVVGVAVPGETIYWERTCGLSGVGFMAGIGGIAIVGMVLLGAVTMNGKK